MHSRRTLDGARSHSWHGKWVALATMLLVMLGAADRSAAAIIRVTSLQQQISGIGGCSLQEAILSANRVPMVSCVLGNGDDTIVLPTGGVFRMSNIFDELPNPFGPTATPIVLSKITIEANGSLLLWDGGAKKARAFAVGSTGDLTIRNAYIKNFQVKGGNGSWAGGGGGLGAGGAIYVKGSGSLTVENSTFEGNGAIGGNGGSGQQYANGGGGGGLSGSGGGPTFGGGGGGGSRGSGGNASGAGLDSTGGGGGGTLTSGTGGVSGRGGSGGLGCGGDGGTEGNDGTDAPCPGGGGGGGGFSQTCDLCALGFNENGNGGKGNYGGGGGGGARDGGDGGFGGGGALAVIMTSLARVGTAASAAAVVAVLPPQMMCLEVFRAAAAFSEATAAALRAGAVRLWAAPSSTMAAP